MYRIPALQRFLQFTLFVRNFVSKQVLRNERIKLYINVSLKCVDKVQSCIKRCVKCADVQASRKVHGSKKRRFVSTCDCMTGNTFSYSFANYLIALCFLRGHFGLSANWHDYAFCKTLFCDVQLFMIIVEMCKSAFYVTITCKKQ